LAIFLHPDAADAAAVATVNQLIWSIVHWAYLIGDLALLTGLLLVFRAIGRGPAEGWAAFALVAGGFALTLDVISSAIHLVNFPDLVDTIASGDPGAAATFVATAAVNGSTGSVSTAFLMLAVLGLGFALRSANRAVPLALVGIVLGAAQLLFFVLDLQGVTILPTTGVAANVIAATLVLWFVLVGVMLPKSQSGAASQAA
jgi:hypothetical protein